MNDHVANDALYKRASYLMWKERWTEAAKLLKPKCAQEKDDWRWCWNLGWCYFKLGKLEFAQKYLFRATQVSPNNASCKWALGTVYLKQKRYRKAERILAESLMLKDTHNTRIALALAYLARGKVTEAENTHLEGIRLRPKRSEGYESYAAFLSDVGREAEAQNAVVYLSVAFFVANTAFGQSACSATADGALHSCEAGARSDYLLALAKCTNESDALGRTACRNRAQAGLSDSLNKCNALLSARQQICQFLGGKRWDPEINPANFSTKIDNPYFPLKPGTTYEYQAHTADGLITNFVVVTHKTKAILGVTCVEVHDTVFLNGQKTEDTLDWYAQDGDGNVWYFGEDSEDLTNGRVSSLAGSWKAGVNGAEPGIIMEAHPKVGDAYRQELLLNKAEDFARVLSLDNSVKVPFGSFDNCLKTTESSGVEPGAVEFKFYAPGVGVVFDNDVSGQEKDSLINVVTE